MSLAELAEESGVPSRTIRFYIARSLLQGPEMAGRGAAYGAAHLQRLRQIRQLQQQGMTLTEIARSLSGEPAAAPQPSAWWHYQVSPDVTVSVRADASPWRLKQVREALQMMAARLAEKEES